MIRTVAISTLAMLVAACGDVTNSGPDGGDGAAQPDSGAVPDGSTQPDALATTGLGQRCETSLAGADCPQNADTCLDLTGAGVGYCSPLCAVDVTATTDAAGQLPLDATSTQVCMDAFTAAVGTPVCNLIATIEPPDNPLQPNTSYVYTAGCGIGCGAGETCPPGLTCDSGNQLCLAQP